MRSDSSSPIDPRRALWRVAGAVALLGGGVTLAAAAWAFAPLDRRSPRFARSGAPLTTAKEAGGNAARAQVDVKAFDAALWSKAPVLAPDAAAEAERAKRATVDLHVDLIGVTDENGQLVAALYDRDHDRVLLVKDGDELPLGGGARVKKLTLDEVVLRHGEQEVALARRRPER